MSKQTPRFSSAVLRSWSLPLIAAGVVAAAVWSYGRPGEVQAAPGSPYYDKAVKEAMNGLTQLGESQATPAARPPLPAGLAPDDYYWCDQHQTYHKREGAAAVPNMHPEPAIPPLVAGKPPGDYDWCEQCRAFHLRAQPPPQPAVGTNPAPAGAPATPPTPGAEVIPPLPAGYAAADYYWCPNCKAYHPREAGTPGHPDETPPSPSPAPDPKPPGSR